MFQKLVLVKIERHKNKLKKSKPLKSLYNYIDKGLCVLEVMFQKLVLVKIDRHKNK